MNGEEGVALAQARVPDVILMDIVMPVMDGLEATRRIRLLPALRAVPILALSASATSADQVRTMAAGANAFITKPIAHDQLLEQMRVQMGLEWTYEELVSSA